MKKVNKAQRMIRTSISLPRADFDNLKKLAAVNSGNNVSLFIRIWLGKRPGQ